MFHKMIHEIHKFMLSQMMEWCGSHQVMELTLWSCLAAMLYVVFVFLLKTLKTLGYRGRKEESDVLTILCKAIEQNDIVKCVKLLEEYPQCINRFTRDGYTPFLIACANGNTQLVRLMLRRGADIRLKSFKKESPFYLAAFYYIRYPQYKNATCIRELYYAGADINEANERCLTPLQLAAMFGHTALVKWLLLKKASTNTVPDPYVIACAQGHQDTARLIWKSSTNFSITSK